MRYGKHLGAAMGLAAASLVTSADRAHAQYAGDLRQAPYAYEDIFPIFGKKLAARGVAFPLPWGVGLTYLFMQQPIDISNIALGVDDRALVDVGQVVKFKSVESKVHALNARLDLWLFPFLNVYVMGNYSPKTRTNVQLSDPFELDAEAVQWIVGEGFGTTAAFGMFGAWLTLDANWTWNHAELVDASIRTTIVTPRLGARVARWGKVELDLWVGMMAQFIESETRGSIRLSNAVGDPNVVRGRVSSWHDGLGPVQQRVVGSLAEAIEGPSNGDPTIKYVLDKKVAQRCNMLVGAQLALDAHWFIRTEVGFIERESFMLGLNYRFHTPGFAP